MEKAKRFETLDSLRGIAAVCVMLFHYLWGYNNEFGLRWNLLVDFKYGFFGVELFFIISGFVIYYSINKSKTVKDFLSKRFIRLYPTYWLCLAITFMVVYYFGLSSTRNTTMKEALIGLTMLQGLFKVKHVDPSYWSLQIEIFFYIFIAVIFFLKIQSRLKYILWGWLFLIWFYNFIYKIPVLGAFLNLQYGMLFIAGICFYKIKFLKDSNFKNHLLIILTYLTALKLLNDMEGYFWGITIIYIVFYLTIYGFLDFLDKPIFLFFGRISYALYLIHDNIGLVVLQQLRMKGFNSPFLVIIPAFLSICLAWLISYYFEPVAKALLQERSSKMQTLTAA